MKYDPTAERLRILARLLAHLQAGRLSADAYERMRRYVQAEHSTPRRLTWRRS